MGNIPGEVDEVVIQAVGAPLGAYARPFAATRAVHNLVGNPFHSVAHISRFS
jgi:hypothetical protein